MMLCDAVQAMLDGKKVKFEDSVFYFSKEENKFKVLYSNGYEDRMMGYFSHYEGWELAEEYEYKWVIMLPITGNKLTEKYYKNEEDICDTVPIICRADWTKRLAQ